jgi:hypothetical protein
VLRRFRPRLSYANVMVTILVFIVLGGGAYAAIHLPKNSVGSRQLKKNAVVSPKVKNGSLKNSDTALQWAVVSRAGTVKSQSGGITVVQGAGSGEVTIDFGRSLRGRSVQVTPLITGADVAGGSPGAWAAVGICGAPTTTDDARLACDNPFNTSHFAVVATYETNSSAHVPHTFTITAF